MDETCRHASLDSRRPRVGPSVWSPSYQLAMNGNENLLTLQIANRLFVERIVHMSEVVAAARASRVAPC